jgi:hypothetical protein
VKIIEGRGHEKQNAFDVKTGICGNLSLTGNISFDYKLNWKSVASKLCPGA